MRNRMTLPNLFLLLILLYHSQGWLYNSGSIISRSILLVWLTISLLYALRYLFGNEKDAISNAIFIFWLMNAIYWLFSEKQVYSNDECLFYRTIDNFKNITTGFLTYFPLKYWLDREDINEKTFKYFSLFLLFVMVPGFYWNNYVSLLNTNRDFVTSNYAYQFVLLFPLLGLFFYKRSFLFIITLLSYFIIMGSKRGAILCFVFQIVVFFYIRLKGLPAKKKIVGALSLLFVFIFIVFFAIRMYGDNEYLQSRIELTEEGNSSGRDELYSGALSVYGNSDFLELLFGHGMCKSVYLIGNYAHNDWLELLLDHGLFGVILYFMLFWKVGAFYQLNSRYLDSKYRFMLLVAIMSLFIKSIFSMGYTSQSVFLIFIPVLLVIEKVKTLKDN